jgi:glyoxylase-like metal-dependent hydrolase (beta-lactamase superfamily II)
VLVRTVVSPLLGAACHVVADAAGRCVIVDPGVGVADEVLALVAELTLDPVGVLATHGHVDHTWSAAVLCRELGQPLSVHQADAYRVDDPIGTLGPLGSQLAALAGAVDGPERPDRVLPFTTGAAGRARIDLAGFGITAMHAPGHTEGSTIYLVDDVSGDDDPLALTGDVLFTGTIGRTDLPGGDPEAMARTLGRVARLAPATVVLPGHGPATTIAIELASNPYLVDPGRSAAR